MGKATKSLAQQNKSIETFTKWVPSPGPMTRQVVEDAIDYSLQRMQAKCIDLLQFHWWGTLSNIISDQIQKKHNFSDPGRSDFCVHDSN